MRTHNYLTTIALVVAALCGAAHAQPLVDKLNVQGYLQQSTGGAVSNGTYHIAFAIEQNGTYFWGVEQNVQVFNGLFSATLSGAAANLTGLAATCPTIAQAFAGSLNAAALMAQGAGEVSVHVCTVDAINGNTGLNFDIPIGAVPTAFVADIAKNVAAASVTLAGMAASTYSSTFHGAADTGKFVALNSSGLVDTTFLPNLTVSGGVASGGTGGTNGSIQGSGNVTYQSANGGTTTIGNSLTTATTIIQAGSGGINETVQTAAGNIVMAAGATSGAITIGGGSTGPSVFGNTGAGSTTTIQSGTGGLLLAPTAGGVVQVTQGGINLVNPSAAPSGQSVTVYPSAGLTTSYNFVLPINGGTSGQFLTTDGTGTTSWNGINSLNPTGALTVGGGTTTTVSMIPAGPVNITPSGANAIDIGGSGSNGVTLDPAGPVAISPTAGGIAMNPSPSLSLGGASTSTLTMSPSGTVTINPTGAITVGGASLKVNSLASLSSSGFSVAGTGSGALTITAGALTGSGYGVIMPPAQAAGVLQNDGSGNLSWATVATSGSNTNISSLNPGGTLTLAGGAEVIDPSGAVSITPSGPVNMNPTGALTLGGTSAVINTGGNFSVTNTGATTINPTGAVTIGGSGSVFNATGNISMTPTGAVTINPTGAVTIGGASTELTAKVGVGVVAPTAELHLAAGTATASTSPLKFTSGVNLTTPEAGAIEYDGTNFYGTGETTSGRGMLQTIQDFHLTSTGAGITTIGNFFGANSNITLVSGATYDIDVYCWFAKATANTIVWTLTNSAAPTSQNIYYEMSPITGVVAPPGTATMLVGQVVNGVAAVQTFTTGNLSVANHYAHFHIFLVNGTGTSLKIQATATTGSVNPLIGSYWLARRLPTANVGTFSP